MEQQKMKEKSPRVYATKDSYILEERMDELDDIIKEVLRLRFQVLQTTSFLQIFNYSSQENSAFIRSCKKTKGEHWRTFRDYVTKRESEPATTLAEAASRPQPDYTKALPSVELKNILHFSVLSDEEKTAADVWLRALTKRFFNCVNIDRILEVVAKEYTGPVVISQGQIYEAALMALSRLSRHDQHGNVLKYLKTWIKAVCNTEADYTFDQTNMAKKNNSREVRLQDETAIGRSVEEIIGSTGGGLSSIEEAEESYMWMLQCMEGMTRIETRLRRSLELAQKSEELERVKKIEAQSEHLTKFVGQLWEHVDKTREALQAEAFLETRKTYSMFTDDLADNAPLFSSIPGSKHVMQKVLCDAAPKKGPSR